MTHGEASQGKGRLGVGTAGKPIMKQELFLVKYLFARISVPPLIGSTLREHAPSYMDEYE